MPAVNTEGNTRRSGMDGSVTDQRFTLHYDDMRGWSIRTPRGVDIFGPTWSRVLVEAYAQENGIQIPTPEIPK